MLISSEHTCEPGMDHLRTLNQCYKSYWFKQILVSGNVLYLQIHNYTTNNDKKKKKNVPIKDIS